MPQEDNSPSGIVYKLDAERRLIAVVAWGKPSAEDFIQSIRSLIVDPHWQPGFDVLVDYRKLSNFAFSTPGIQRVSELFKQEAKLLGDGKCAVVAPNLFIYGLFRMWKPWLPDELKWTVESFRDYDEACAWLGHIDPKIE